MFTVSAVGRGPGFGKATVGRALAALLALWCCQVAADIADPLLDKAELLHATTDLPRPHVEVTAAPVPSLDANDGGMRSSRIDLSLMPQQRSGVGLALGIRSRSRPVVGFAPEQPTASDVDLGVRWRYTSQNNHRFDVTAYRRAQAPDAASLAEDREPSYGARVEMGLAASKNLRKGFVADRGFVGVQLESGGRLTIRRKFGGPMLYYRNTFY